MYEKINNFKNPIIVVSIICFIAALFYFPFIFRSHEKKDVKLGGSSINNACEITIQVSGSDIPIDLEEYVIGVVAAEMPVSFHIEALKAQAIAARTYVLKNTNYGQIPIEPTVAKQVFYDEDTRKENWDKSYEEFEKRSKKLLKALKVK